MPAAEAPLPKRYRASWPARTASSHGPGRGESLLGDHFNPSSPWGSIANWAYLLSPRSVRVPIASIHSSRCSVTLRRRRAFSPLFSSSVFHLHGYGPHLAFLRGWIARRRDRPQEASWTTPLRHTGPCTAEGGGGAATRSTELCCARRGKIKRGTQARRADPVPASSSSHCCHTFFELHWRRLLPRCGCCHCCCCPVLLTRHCALGRIPGEGRG